MSQAAPSSPETSASSARNPLACPPPRAGDTVVHLDFGLCRLGALRTLTLSDGDVQTVELAFKDGETRHVPVCDAVRLWNYGAYLPDRKLDPVGGTDWAARQAERVMEMRATLGALRARRDARLARTGFAVALKDHLDAAADGFEHDLTDCQARALSEIADDLAAQAPTNRLLIGDVGCGKTEVALRALLATARAGHAVRLVAPTRVLARQHFADVRDRAEALGLRVALYSGDRTDAEKREVVESAGQTDILIGTHGLLGERFADIDFGLTVIDEEQKFGLKIKQAGFHPDAGGNCLRLSATPIPSTLAEARVGVAELSVIQSYPAGRGATETRVASRTDAALREAGAAEFARGGQLIVMAPRIKDLRALKPKLRALFPDRRFGLVHGQRKAKANRKTLQRLRDGALDGVLATTVLETGINLPNANTMVVMRPGRFGLAQLHQLRGRIGRGRRSGHFVLLRKAKRGEADANKGFARRLRVLEALSARGDGLALSLADAMLRGSGTLDDERQSGHASAVGLELFDYLLRTGADTDSESFDPFVLIPKIAGEADWGPFPGEREDEALVAAITNSRGALAGRPGPDALSRLIARCRAIGADHAAVGPKGVVLSRGGRAALEAASLDEALSSLDRAG